MKPTPKLVGVLNVTPDSFSEGGDFSEQTILAKAQQLIEDGANVLDVGAESTRPGATLLSATQEWQRLEPIWLQLVTICQQHDVHLSLDTRHAETAAEALAHGCDWINDVSGFTSEAMLATVKNARCKLVVMHSLSIPANKNETLPEALDVIAFMRGWIEETSARLYSAGIAPERIVYDPGIGFGKTARHSWQLLARLPEWRCDAPVLIGHSRKSFFSLFSDAPASERDALTGLCSAMLAAQGADYLRVHDVAGHRQMFEKL